MYVVSGELLAFLSIGCVVLFIIVLIFFASRGLGNGRKN